ncbi:MULTISPECIES: polyprenyl synthetase family protein [unclassified Streptomyces]|uniref:polyprenyl synthetase family protein n=1 Tax=unclassified Streptomyces TaxID=2593676 RepID=UPI001BE7FCFE|nr:MULTISPECIES: polyprenyl synthetase family protein [unclassified Streptomyces]MBT2405887.1 polyprenyl synthetase family protein [Streptomyces sp. ISL-21]MBT2612295.1 polyprenyl synthetase family protein [Streptomyces sp. ISL-87]
MTAGAVRSAVDSVLDDFLTAKDIATNRTELSGLTELLRDFMSEGKRLRPLFCAIGWQAVGGGDDTDSLFRVAACLEMFHAFALIHDDVMDQSDTRRGRPTIHRALASRHASGRDRTRRDRLGENAAILLGDLALIWSDELLLTGALTADQLLAALPIVAEMRTEVMLGQYLDLQATGELSDDVDATLLVNRFKTAKYTIERPLHIGAALAGADAGAMDAFTRYALPLGEAFQLRDDLLGVYGDPSVTGKSRLDDLREAKRTTLVALALRAADDEQAARLRELIGNPLLDERDAAAIREVFAATGARDAVERMIDDRREQAVRALEESPFTQQAIRTLTDIAVTATARKS